MKSLLSIGLLAVCLMSAMAAQADQTTKTDKQLIHTFNLATRSRSEGFWTSAVRTTHFIAANVPSKVRTAYQDLCRLQPRTYYVVGHVQRNQRLILAKLNKQGVPLVIYNRAHLPPGNANFVGPMPLSRTPFSVRKLFICR